MIGMILIGFIVGVVARFLMPGRDPMGFIVTTLLGVAGAALAGILGRSLGWYRPGEPVGFIASVVGALILLGIYGWARGRNRSAITTRV
jgi:uncharacterized membrane protein YeaQ/YmgE (transglycosylase-associated protein family)